MKHFKSPTLTLVICLLGLLALVGLGISLTRSLPDEAWIAKYIENGRGRVDFKQPQQLRNPWLPMAGCLLLEGGLQYVKTDARSDIGCKVMLGDDPTAQVVNDENLTALASSTLAFRQEASTFVSAQGQTAPQGQSAQLTINSELQAMVMAYSQCMSGNFDVCKDLEVPTHHWKTHYEGAAARMLGVAVIDIPTGEVRAMGGAHSKCYGADHSSSKARSSDCPDLPLAPAARSYRLNAHHLAQAMPASTVKPLIALAALSEPAVSARLHGAGRSEFFAKLASSNAQYFLNLAFCADKGFQACTRLERLREMAITLGWNNQCDRHTLAGCALFNLLYAPQNPPSGNYALLGQYKALSGRVMAAHTGREAYSVRSAQNCATEAPRWEKCRSGGVFIDLMSEAYGQGNALASPLGMAQLYTNIARRAAELPMTQVHVLRGNELEATEAVAAGKSGTGKSPIRAKDAALVLQGLTGAHREGGTAFSACLRVYGSPQFCKHERWSSKTGTNTFAHKDKTLSERAALCRKDKITNTERANCAIAPYKWFVTLMKDANGQYSTAIAVLAERNWIRHTGLVDSPRDRGSPNVAAELGIRLARAIEAKNQKSQIAPAKQGLKVSGAATTPKSAGDAS